MDENDKKIKNAPKIKEKIFQEKDDLSESREFNDDFQEDPPSSLEDYASNDSMDDQNEEILKQKQPKTNKKKIKTEKKKKKIDKEEYLKF